MVDFAVCWPRLDVTSHPESQRLVTGIDCDSRHGAPLRDLLAAHMLEEEFGAACNPAGWLQEACADTDRSQPAIQRDGERVSRSIITVSA